MTPAFTWPVRVYWEDTDAGGVVYYANYLRFFERARTEWLRACGIHQQAMLTQTGCMFVVTQADVHYHRSARLDDTLLIDCALGGVGRAGITLLQQARREGDDPTPLCTVTIRAAWVQTGGARAQRIPPHILAALGAPSPTVC